MKILYELSWLWETLGIALVAAVAATVPWQVNATANTKKL